MEKDRNFIDSLAHTMDQNKRGIQYGLYSTALVGLAIAMRSIRPFSKFSSVKPLPSSFIEKHIRLQGRVVAVEPSGLLNVDHFPIWSLPFKTSDSFLPINIDSVQVLGLGTTWLQTVLKGEAVHFMPVSVKQDSLSCIVLREKKNVGIQLVSLGFATVQPFHNHLHTDQLYIKYYKDLLAAEEKAETERAGMWSNSQQGHPATAVAVNTAKKIYGLLNRAVATVRHKSSRSNTVQ